MSTTNHSQMTGLNGVAIPKPQRSSDASGDQEGAGYRTYEVYQRERVGESTEKIKPIQLLSADYVANPFPLSSVLRDNYPCYRDWLSNCYWVCGYDDVTSLFTDDANFISRSKAWYYQQQAVDTHSLFGTDFSNHPQVQSCWAAGLLQHAEATAAGLLHNLPADGADLAQAFAALFQPRLTARLLNLPTAQDDRFAQLLWQAERGAKWQPTRVKAGLQAVQALGEMLAPLLSERRRGDGEDLISVVAQLGGSPADLVATLLEQDHVTLHGALANLWHQLLTVGEDTASLLAELRAEKRLLKVAYLETLRHSPPVISAHRFARHEVERFGRLIPEGSLVKLSAAGANRDPRIFAEPDTFMPHRTDICHREARGQYRADGLASGIAFGLGKPSTLPAVPESRPPSLYAQTRDAALIASQLVLDTLDNLRLQTDAAPLVRCLGVDELYTCWSLPVSYNKVTG